MKGLLSFKVTANFPGFKRVGEEDIDNECAFSTGSLINFPPLPLPLQNRFSFLFGNMGKTQQKNLTSRRDLPWVLYQYNRKREETRGEMK